MENLRDYDKVFDDLQLAHLRENRDAVIDILRHLVLTDIIDNKHIPIIGSYHAKFVALLSQIQDSLFRSANIRHDFHRIDQDIQTLSLISSKNLLPVSIGKYWALCVSEASSIIARGDIVNKELTFSKEEDLIHKLKRDIYEKFINSHSYLNMEDISKNCARYLQSVGEAFSGLQLCSKVYTNLEVSKKEFSTAAKDLIKALSEKLDSITAFIDYRLVNHEELSIAVGTLLSILKRVYFETNPEEENKVLKENLFRLLIEYYKYLMRSMVQGSMTF